MENYLLNKESPTYFHSRTRQQNMCISALRYSPIIFMSSSTSCSPCSFYVDDKPSQQPNEIVGSEEADCDGEVDVGDESGAKEGLNNVYFHPFMGKLLTTLSKC